MVTQWKGRLEKEAAQVFEGKSRAGEPPVDVDALYRKIGQIEMEREFLASRPGIVAALRRGRQLLALALFDHVVAGLGEDEPATRSWVEVEPLLLAHAWRLTGQSKMGAVAKALQ